MENNLNYSGIERYCDQFANKVLGEYYEGKTIFGGNDLLKLTAVKQVNLFIVKNLFNNWKKEAENAKGPYFNYQSEDVKKALANYMNVLSRNIAVKKADLHPLITKAAYDTILLIFSPYDFYTHHVVDNSNKISMEDFIASKKYTKVNTGILDGLIDAAKREDASHLDQTKINQLLQQVFEQTDATPEDVTSYQQQFSKIVPLNEEVIYGKQEEQSTTEKVGHDEMPPHPAVKKPAKDKPQATLNDKLINEGKKPSLAEIHQQQKIQSIDKYLSINQRFMFVNTLFKGNADEFQQVIQKIEQSTYKEAFDYLTSNYPEWNTESEEVEEFFEMVEKRLS